MTFAPTLEAERAEFEAAMPDEHPRDRNMPDKSYNSPFLHIAWQVWQIARRTATPAPADIALSPKQSIDTPEFRALVEWWAGAAHSCDKHTRTVRAKAEWAKLIAYIDGRTAGTAPASLVECTQAMLEAAMKAAVAAKMFPPSGSEHTYLRYWYGMKASVDAALAAAPSPLPPKEEVK